MDNLQALFNTMACVTWILQVAILIGMYRKDLMREFRIFFAYTAFTLFQSLSLVAIRNYFGYRSVAYFDSYWIGFAIHIVLMFFIIQEVYAKVLCRYEGLRALSNIIFRWAFMLLVLLATTSALNAPAPAADWMYSNILRIDYSTRIVEFGLIVLLFVLARAFALSWRECVFGIAVGTCFYCSTELAILTLRTHYGPSVADLHAILSPLLGIITLSIWALYMYRAEHKRVTMGLPQNPQLEEWNRAVLQFLNR